MQLAGIFFALDKRGKVWYSIDVEGDYLLAISETQKPVACKIASEGIIERPVSMSSDKPTIVTTIMDMVEKQKALSTHLPSGCAGWKKSSLATCKRAVKRGWLRERADSGQCGCCGTPLVLGEMPRQTMIFINPYSGVQCTTSRCVGRIIDAILYTPGGVRDDKDMRLWNSLRMLVANEDARAYSDIID